MSLPGASSFTKKGAHPKTNAINDTVKN